MDEATAAAASAPPVPIITNTDWNTPQNTVSLLPLPSFAPSAIESSISGGTVGLLDQCRATASFHVDDMMHFLDGGKEHTIRRRFIQAPTKYRNFMSKYNHTRQEALTTHLQLFCSIHDKYVTKMVPTRQDIAYMTSITSNGGSLSNHWGLGVSTILSQSNDEQRNDWLPLVVQNKMTVAYAQTELGHGSSVQNLRTIAQYDHVTESFVISTPTLQAIKWWPGCLGATASHALVYAQLLIDQHEYGIHSFLVQIRDENHRPVPGCQVGSVGNCLGDFGNDCGFLALQHVVVPKNNMLARFQYIDESGVYHQTESKQQNPQLHYLTMLMTRGGMVMKSGGILARGVVTAIRYAFVRKQGRQDRALTQLTIDITSQHQQQQQHHQQQHPQQDTSRPHLVIDTGLVRLPTTTIAHLGREVPITSLDTLLGEQIDPQEQQEHTNQYLKTVSAIPSLQKYAHRANLTAPPHATPALQQLVTNTNNLFQFQQAEYPIVEYPVHRLRLLRQLAWVYVLKCTGRWLIAQFQNFEGNSIGPGMQTPSSSTTTSIPPEPSSIASAISATPHEMNFEMLKLMAVTTAGLKSFSTQRVVLGLEEMRQCLGGNGYLRNTGIGPLYNDYLWEQTAEGERIVMSLTAGKSILQHLLTPYTPTDRPPKEQHGEKWVFPPQCFRPIGKSNQQLSQDIVSMQYLDVVTALFTPFATNLHHQSISNIPSHHLSFPSIRELDFLLENVTIFGANSISVSDILQKTTPSSSSSSGSHHCFRDNLLTYLALCVSHQAPPIFHHHSSASSSSSSSSSPPTTITEEQQTNISFVAVPILIQLLRVMQYRSVIYWFQLVTMYYQLSINMTIQPSSSSAATTASSSSSSLTSFHQLPSSAHVELLFNHLGPMILRCVDAHSSTVMFACYVQVVCGAFAQNATASPGVWSQGPIAAPPQGCPMKHLIPTDTSIAPHTHSSDSNNNNNNNNDNNNSTSLLPPLMWLGLLHISSELLDDGMWLQTCTTTQPSTNNVVASASLYFAQLLSQNALIRDMLALTDALDINDSVLASTVGNYDGIVYERLFQQALTAEFNQSSPFVGYNETLRSRQDVELLQQGREEQDALFHDIFGKDACHQQLLTQSHTAVSNIIDDRNVTFTLTLDSQAVPAKL